MRNCSNRTKNIPRQGRHSNYPRSAKEKQRDGEGNRSTYRRQKITRAEITGATPRADIFPFINIHCVRFRAEPLRLSGWETREPLSRIKLFTIPESCRILGKFEQRDRPWVNQMYPVDERKKLNHPIGNHSLEFKTFVNGASLKLWTLLVQRYWTKLVIPGSEINWSLKATFP